MSPKAIAIETGRSIVDTFKSPLPWFVLSLSVYVVSYFVSGQATENAQRHWQREESEQSIRQTDAGRFALDHAKACLASGSLLGPAPTIAACVNETATLADNVRGAAFAGEVRVALADHAQILASSARQ